MKLLAFLFISIAAICYVSSEEEYIESDDGVLVLNKKNFPKAISDNQYILVEFYAPWCGHCKALAPEYVKAAKALADKESSIKLGKVDATEESELAEQHGVRGYPTLKFFKNGSPVDYNGGRQADDIVNWLLKKTGPPAKELKTVEEAKEFTQGHNVAVIGFFKDQDTDRAKSFLKVASSIDDHPFAITSEDALFEEYGVKCGTILLFKKFDEGKVEYDGDDSEAQIKKFIQSNSLPLLVEFNHETAQKIFGGEIKSHLILFLNKEEEHFQKISDAARSVAKPFREQILFVSIDTNEEDHQRILEFFGMKKSDAPAARIIRLEEDMAKYRAESDDLSADAIKKFVEDFLAGKLKQHLLSEDLPEDWDKTPVKTLVATNFDKVALDAEKDVLVEFYAPWCGHCKQLVPIYEKVGEHFKDNDDVVIAKMDATANELEHTKISSFPTLKLYAKGSNKIIEYNGPRNFEGLVKFVESGGADSASNEEPVEEETEDDDSPRKDEL
ncbi:hypothetical protein WA026_013264 [Henosepilachna vigintioctopunctata]|uniref:Protein disulfide-isomerase n=1 Tax=Henosepilachna vigintioctopunctata TaxID=420089 RepID=A0AAW1UEI2_9CUCU